MIDAIKEGFVTFGIWLVSSVYHVATWAYQIFMDLAAGKIIDSSVYQDLINKIYVLIGIIMLFVLAFSLLKGMVNPDDQAKGTSVVAKVIKDMVISTIIIAVIPTVFGFAFDFQASILDYGSIGNIFGFANGASANGEVNTDRLKGYELIKQEASELVNGVFSAFLYPSSSKLAAECGNDIDTCKGQILAKRPTKLENLHLDTDLNSVESYVAQTGDYGLYTAFAGNEVDGDIEFDFLLSLAAGVLLLYVGVSFCFDMALRMIKLVFYQVIAPIPVFLRVVPQGKLNGVFNNWLKVVGTVYAEVFVRILSIYFVIWLFQKMKAINFFATSNVGMIGLLTKAFILLGLVMFMRQAPKLFSEVTGLDSGNMKLGIKEKMKDSGLYAAANLVGGGIAAGIGSKDFFTTVSGAIQGARHGWNNANLEGIGNAYANGYEFRNAKEMGASRTQIWADRYRRALKLPTYAEMLDRQIERSEETVENIATSSIHYKIGTTDYEIAAGDSVTLSHEAQEAIDNRNAELEDEVIDTRNIIERINSEIEFRKFFASVVGSLEDEGFGDMTKGKVRGINYDIAKDVTEIDGEFYIDDGEGGKQETKVVAGQTITLKNGQQYNISRIANGRAYYTDAKGKEHVLSDKGYFDGSYESFIKWYDDLSADMKEKINIEETKLNTAIKYIGEQAKDSKNNAIKNIIAASYEQLYAQKDGVSFKRYVIDPKTGNYALNADGTRQIEEGVLKATFDQNTGKYSLSSTLTRADGSIETKNYTGEDYEVWDDIKKVFKEDARVRNDEVSNHRNSTSAQEQEIKAISMLKSAIAKAREKKKNSPKYKAAKASQGVSGNH